MADLPTARELFNGSAGGAPREITTARIALGRTGTSLRTQDHLAFQLDHALARDAVHTELDTTSLLQKLRERGWPVLSLQSAAHVEGRASGRRQYLQRPDLGRRLHPDSVFAVRAAASEREEDPELVFTVMDGLSALAIERYALPLLEAVQARLPGIAGQSSPVCVVRGGRVALADEIGVLLRARLTVVLIGERPGLSAPDSMGLYITWKPRPGRTDAERNCISNIRDGGLSYEEGAERLIQLLHRARELGRTGVEPGRNTALPSARAAES